MVTSDFNNYWLLKTKTVLTSGWAEDSQIRTPERAYQRSKRLLHQCPQMQTEL